MSRFLRVVLPMAVGLLLLCGCSAGRFWLSGSAPPDRQPIIDALTNKAAAFEANDEIQLALLCWRGVLAYAPTHPEARANLERLGNEAAQQARRSYLEGKQALAADHPRDARRALLQTLRLAPDFEDARQRLYRLMNPPVFKWYHLRPGESLADIALKFYGTPEGDDLIAFANGIPVNAEVLTPRVLKVPIQAARQPFEAQQTEQALARAQALSKDGRHAQVLEITDRLLRADPNLSQAVVLQNKSCFILGQRLFQQQQYLPAQKMLNRIQGPYPGLEALRAEMRTAMQRQAEVHYREGVKFYVNDELKRAVEAWRLTLALDPEHQEAAAGIREAETLLHKLKMVDED